MGGPGNQETGREVQHDMDMTIPINQGNAIRLKMEKPMLSYFNAESLNKVSLPPKVTIYDSTLRDGEQMPGVAFRHSEKIEIARTLSEIGVPQIEAGFPAVSTGEKKAVKEIASLKLGSEILALARTNKSDIDAALECDVDMVMLFMASSDLHLEHKYRITRSQQLENITEALEYASAHGLKYSFSTEDSTRTEYDYLLEISRLAENLGACRIGISDTTGCILPRALGGLVKNLVESLNVPVSVHLHNDYGLALANALASIENGSAAVATTVNGIGERAGNVPTEMLAIALETIYGIDTGIDLSSLTKVCTRVSELSGVGISKNHPWVGTNAFKHESGIHIAAIMSNPSTYECLPPETVGGKRELVLGKHSGRFAVTQRLQKLGLSISEAEVKHVVEKVKELSQEGQRIDDNALLDIVKQCGGGK